MYVVRAGWTARFSPLGTQMRSPKPPNDEVATLGVTSSFGGLGARLRWAQACDLLAPTAHIYNLTRQRGCTA